MQYCFLKYLSVSGNESCLFSKAYMCIFQMNKATVTTVVQLCVTLLTVCNSALLLSTNAKMFFFFTPLDWIHTTTSLWKGLHSKSACNIPFFFSPLSASTWRERPQKIFSWNHSMGVVLPQISLFNAIHLEQALLHLYIKEYRWKKMFLKRKGSNLDYYQQFSLKKFHPLWVCHQNITTNSPLIKP